MKAIAGAVGGGVLIVAFAALVLLFTPPAGAAECGTASFYSEAHQGKPMANRQPFNMYALTAASWSYPLGAKVRVTAGHKSVVVTVTDRGPNHRLHRIIDLSLAAFAKLAPPAQGIIRNVCIVRLK